MMCLVVIYVWRGSTLSQSPGTVETHANTISGFPVCSLLKCAALLMRQQTLSCVAHNIPVSFQHDYENLVGLQRAPEGSRQWRIPSFSIRVVFRCVLCCVIFVRRSLDPSLVYMGDVAILLQKDNIRIWHFLRDAHEWVESQSKFDVNLYTSKRWCLRRFSLKRMTSEYDVSFYSRCKFVSFKKMKLTSRFS